MHFFYILSLLHLYLLNNKLIYGVSLMDRDFDFCGPIENHLQNVKYIFF